MTSLERMSHLVDLDICKSSVTHALTSVAMASELASSYQLLVCIK